MGGLVSALPLSIKDLKKDAVANMRDRGKAAIILVRMILRRSAPQGEGGLPGIPAYSKICTMWAVPSPCTSTARTTCCALPPVDLDLADSGDVIFGPSARRMPQLLIRLDEEGFPAQSISRTCRPSFWERG